MISMKRLRSTTSSFTLHSCLFFETELALRAKAIERKMWTANLRDSLDDTSMNCGDEVDPDLLLKSSELKEAGQVGQP